jgi:thiamine pyrophosphate-dependent acetolactate synthase large subunit-like protein
MRAFVDATGIPFFTTPQGRGVIPEDHALAFTAARNTAFREADVALVVGTRFNFVIFFGRAPKFNPDVKVIHVNVEPEDISKNRPVDVGIVADAKMAFRQLTEAAAGRIKPERYRAWVEHLAEVDRARWESLAPKLSSEDRPIHPLRVCKELREFLDRDAVLVVDGHETLNFARQSIPTHSPGHRLNAGANGCMGVGVPYAIGAALAKPDKQVVLFSGDGSFSMNMINLDVCVRHKIPLLCVISNNQGWTGATRGKDTPGRWLLPNRYDKMVADLGGYGECVEDPGQIRGAIERAYERAVADKIPAVVNVMTDPYAKATTGSFGGYSGFE